MPQYPANINLSSLDGTNGFQIQGSQGFDSAGGAVSAAGDINGDGFDDILIGAPSADPYGRISAGMAYVVFGKASFAATIQLGGFSSSDGFRVAGGLQGDEAGYSLSAAGDFNGDGFADFLVGANRADPHFSYSGTTYVVFGKASGWPTTFNHGLDLGGLGGNGFALNGVTSGNFSGTSIASLGDINGDGKDDIIIGAPGAGASNRGAAYVVFGKSSGFSTVELSALNGTTGFTLNGLANYNNLGFSVAGAGDVNGDGFDDIIVGALGAGFGGAVSGSAYVLFGKASGFGSTPDLSALTGSDGFRLDGVAAYDYAGAAVAGAGDINGDGFDDLIIGAKKSDANGNNSGAVYIVFGKASGFSATSSLSSLNGSNGFLIKGLAAGEQLGKKVAAAGDLNGDGFDDIVVSSIYDSPNGSYSGATYVVFGKASGFGAVFDLSTLNGSNGFKISGASANNFSGRSISAAGDVNGDGIGDLLVGADGASPGGQSGAGTAYVIFGVAPPPVITPTDFNGDHKSDILLQSTNGDAAIWLMNGTTLVSSTTLGISPGTSWLVKAAGDFDGDSKSDIVWQNDNGQAAVWLMNGTTISSNTTLAINPGTSWHVIATGDFNGDSKADLLWQNDNGQADISLMNGTTISSNALLAINPGTSWHVKATGDFDCDGKADILWQNDNGQADISLMNGTVISSNSLLGISPGTSWHAIGSGDFDGDLKSDLLWQNDNGQVAILLMNGTTILSNTTLSVSPGASWHVKGAEDLDGDGKSDILLQNDNGASTVWLMNGTTILSNTSLTNPGIAWRVIAPGTPSPSATTTRRYDFDGDGKSDILFQNTSSGQAAIWFMNGTSLVSSQNAGFNPGTTWHVKGSGDFNGDGKADILWQGDDSSVSVWPMNGSTPTATPIVGFNPGTTWHVIGAGDFDGDGKSDILWQGDSGAAAIWFMNGTSLTTSSTLSLNPGTAWHVKGAADFNGDGKSDILWQNDNGQAAIWLMNGSTPTATPIVGFNPGTTWHVMGAGDFDGDGKADILWQSDTGQAAIWFMNGTTLLSSQNAGFNPGVSWQVKGAADVNGDGKADIIWQNTDTSAAVWLMNGATPTATPIVGFTPGTGWSIIAATGG